MNLHPAVEKHLSAILDMERWLWAHPQTGYREWKAHEYTAAAFEKLGYTLTPARNIPGFYTDIGPADGPKILVMGELDSLMCADHPDADPETGYVHACGHHAQVAALYGLAAALKEPGVMDGWAGGVRLCAVPAEELIEPAFRDSLREQGIIEYASGKVEFLHRGYFEGCHIAILCHTCGGDSIGSSAGGNGCLLKRVSYQGKAVHASVPEGGLNALHMASLGISATNAVRDTFADHDHIRYHPIITQGGEVINAIPSHVVTESYIRGASLTAMSRANRQVNRAIAASAAALGGNVHLTDSLGMAPLHNDKNLLRLLADVRKMVLPDSAPVVFDHWDMGCTDMGDLSCVMPTLQLTCGGAEGVGHGNNYRIADPVMACAGAATAQLYLLDKLLSNSAAEAQKVIAEATPEFDSPQGYFDMARTFRFDQDAVTENPDGTLTLSFGNA